MGNKYLTTCEWPFGWHTLRYAPTMKTYEQSKKEKEKKRRTNAIQLSQSRDWQFSDWHGGACADDDIARTALPHQNFADGKSEKKLPMP